MAARRHFESVRLNYLKFSATAVSAFALVSADERKVPPRTPPQRLNTLKRFAKEWIDSGIKNQINRPQRAERMAGGIDRLFTKMSTAYGKPCGFFDPSLPHGGPNPNSQRRRRAAFAEKVKF